LNTTAKAPGPAPAGTAPAARLQALIFDVDGTLAETERDGHRPAFNAAFADAGLPWQWDEALYGRLLEVTGGKERIRAYVERHGGRLPAGTDAGAFIPELHRAKNVHFARILEAGGIPLRPGVLRLFREARAAGVRLAIATTTSPENLDALLRRHLGPGWRDWFAAVGAGDVVPAKKPAPDIYLRVLDELGLPAGACAAIEDSRPGYEAARAAGLCTVVTVSSYTRDQSFPGAALVVDHLGEPDRPCRVLAGAPTDIRLVDLDAICRACGLRCPAAA